MRVIAFGAITTLVSVAFLHLYWGLGGFWPGHDEASLVDMVIGMPAGTPIPPLWACMIVVVCLLIPAFCVARFSFWSHAYLPKWLSWVPHAALWASAIMFLARGTSTYVSPFLDAVKDTAFYELDRLIYAPLCLLLGVALVSVWFTRARQ